VLEGTAARFAAERGVTRRELRAMIDIADQTDEVVHAADYESFERYVDLNERFHSLLYDAARSPLLERALEHAISLPFAGPSAFVLAEAELPESREVLIVAQSHHRALIDAIDRREGARAESIAREHARLARLNLDIVLRHREVLERLPGASLITLPDRDQGEADGSVPSEASP
jgi:GntR family transcriptional regulator of vanillate catabolism